MSKEPLNDPEWCKKWQPLLDENLKCIRCGYSLHERDWHTICLQREGLG